MDTGSLVVKKVGSAPFSQKDLDEGDCYVIDNGGNGKIFVWKGKLLTKLLVVSIFNIVWTGKKASKEERRAALKIADDFIKKFNYSQHTAIEIVPQGSESALFREFFPDWRLKDEVFGFGKVYTDNKIAKVKQVCLNILFCCCF